jgi:hypothetical protein
MYRQTFFKPNKYNAVKQTYNGYNYDSKLEARQAADLDLMKAGKAIKDWERQFVVEVTYNDKTLLRHKVDFRVHENDGSYTLLETKGIETPEWKLKRKILEIMWLPDHPDHVYKVVK